MCRVSEWPDSPVNGMCRWCLRTTANLRLTWHSYCYNAYRVAAGLSPQQIQKTLCQVCGDPAGELDHKLSIVVASALGPRCPASGLHPSQPAVAVQAMPPAHRQVRSGMRSRMAPRT